MTIAPPTSERAWQDQVLDLARLYGWLVHHCRPAPNRRGRYATPIQGAPGFPDLVLARGGRVVFAELKTDSRSSELTADQTRWRDALLGSGVEWFCWRPRHLGEVREALAPAASIDWRTASDVHTGGKL